MLIDGAFLEAGSLFYVLSLRAENSGPQPMSLNQ